MQRRGRKVCKGEGCYATYFGPYYSVLFQELIKSRKFCNFLFTRKSPILAPLILNYNLSRRKIMFHIIVFTCGSNR